MRLRNLQDKDVLLEQCEYLIRDLNTAGKWKQIFGNDNQVHIEIGMGKGDFIYHMAQEFPNINFVGIEKYSGVIARAIKKYPDSLPNLRIVNFDAIDLEKLFKNEVETIYLNFSDPWPKKRHARRRLTSKDFLVVYDKVFKDKRRIVMKTDNLVLFASSLVSLSEYGYTLKDVNLDLANSDYFNIPTEYETKFINQGVKINYLVAEKEDK